ncbi:hypothetical protein Y1Q_0004531 [Alligator mississippiensis]|uniref:Uncharacterized protein n=1 Tax=Alligator mississippiensis TaxID=8496 RepID=A0A151MAN0_ALLMI|nr:hypothetical protein Y1Q_0004531 [Alligator mississippiensis]
MPGSIHKCIPAIGALAALGALTLLVIPVSWLCLRRSGCRGFRPQSSAPPGPTETQDGILYAQLDLGSGRRGHRKQ